MSLRWCKKRVNRAERSASGGSTGAGVPGFRDRRGLYYTFRGGIV
jgi:hypothetical protein